MKAYIAKLLTSSDEANLCSEEAEATRKHQGADPRVLNDTPLPDQIKDLMLSLPPVQRDRPWSMEELVARLKGRYSPRPTP